MLAHLKILPLYLKLSQIKQVATRKNVEEVQQMVFGKPADSFKLAWFTLPNSLKVPRNPCQTVLIFSGFLFTPGKERMSHHFFDSPAKIMQREGRGLKKSLFRYIHTDKIFQF